MWVMQSGASSQNLDISLKIFMELAVSGLRLAWDLPLLPFLLFSLPYAGSTSVFRKHIACLVLQVQSWNGILPQNESHNSQANMIEMLCRRIFGHQMFKLILE